ncbi:MAG: hypothetical protein OXI01_09155 [Albidovulum sp.]|nr:hypothetical protein [Albidovulum sp.]
MSGSRGRMPVSSLDVLTPERTMEAMRNRMHHDKRDAGEWHCRVVGGRMICDSVLAADRSPASFAFRHDRMRP